VPATSLKQLIFMQEELKRLKAGEKTRTDLTEEQLQEYVNTAWQGLPTKAKTKK
jgi:hypothetical protein